jgi:hypothetical protein
MKQELAVLFAFLALVIPACLFAKGDISKITIESADLKIPIEIIDFRVFKGGHGRRVVWAQHGDDCTWRGRALVSCAEWVGPCREAADRGRERKTSEEQPGLELRLEPEEVQGGIPEAFTFVLFNGSNHDVRIPMRSIKCEDPPFDGNIRLKVEFRPLRPDAPGFGSGCTNDRMDDQPAIMNRVRNWRNLHPGESLSLKAVRKRLLYRYEEPGTYEFSAAHYFPPSVTRSDREALNQAGIDFPQNELTSAHVTFVKEP